MANSEQPVKRSVAEFTLDAEDAEQRRFEAENRLERQRKRAAELADRRDVLVRMKRGHDTGVHWVGYCPFCPANVYYD